MLEECRLEEESFTRALRITGKAYVILIDKRLYVIGDIFNLDVRDLGRAHLSFEIFSQTLFALRFRVGAHIFLSFNCAMARKLHANVTFERSIVSQFKFRYSLNE